MSQAAEALSGLQAIPEPSLCVISYNANSRNWTRVSQHHTRRGAMAGVVAAWGTGRWSRIVANPQRKTEGAP